MTLERKLLHTLRQRDLLPHTGVLVVAVSGGTDSLALLHLLHALGENRLGCALHVATFDHNLRGDASRADAEFVVATCEAWGIPVMAERAMFKIAPDANVEAIARHARYRFLAQVAEHVGASHVATAHHQGDQAETVLMRLLRGAGLRGLGAMTFKAPLPYAPHLSVIRPLLDVSRAEIEAYINQHGLQPRDDATNRDLHYMRNRVRHEVLPFLRRVSPQIDRLLAQFADVARVDDDFVEGQLHAAIAPHVQIDAERICLPREVFAVLHPALQRRFVAWAAERLSRSDDDAAYVHVLAAVDVALSSHVGAVAQLPGNLHLRVDYESLVVEQVDAPRSQSTYQLSADIELPVTIPGEIITPEGWSLRVEFSPTEDRPVRARLRLPEGATVVLRTRRQADRFAPLGMGGHSKKLSRWMIDCKIPLDERDNVPLLVVDGQIVAVLWSDQWAVAETFRFDKNEGTTVYVS